MRHFVVIGQTADAAGAFSLEDIAGTSGRIDVLVRCLRAALCVSHGLRTDVVVDLVLLGGPRAPRTLRIDGARARFIRPDERSLATLVKKALLADASGEAFVEVKPGVLVRDAGLPAVIAELRDASAYVLDENGADLRTSIADADDVVFFLGDHRGFDEASVRAIASSGARPVSVGPVSVHADDAVTLAMNELDRRRASSKGSG
jgi:tRNA (pseudouridine54-N1)-methyltransferase